MQRIHLFVWVKVEINSESKWIYVNCLKWLWCLLQLLRSFFRRTSSISFNSSKSSLKSLLLVNPWVTLRVHCKLNSSNSESDDAADEIYELLMKLLQCFTYFVIVHCNKCWKLTAAHNSNANRRNFILTLFPFVPPNRDWFR